ncbi:hypothetical protein CAEBREN_14056 [Caenorhabditis brenneri]|uniref:Uncharacterized protein n=1 Tax=Caenorhabditis brenneri TaxID=135651 RepID=G0NBA1_CAEBE|nr:hypothetical protein CAEBREN_14056 [Caenorhabditis brenneri]
MEIWSMAAEWRGAFDGWMRRKSMGRRRRVYWLDEDRIINKRLCHGTIANGHKTASRKTAKRSKVNEERREVLVKCNVAMQQKSCWVLETKRKLTTQEKDSRRNVSNTSSSTCKGLCNNKFGHWFVNFVNIAFKSGVKRINFVETTSKI